MSTISLPREQRAARRKHGTRAMYVGERCRCFACRVANAGYQNGRDQEKLRRSPWLLKYARQSAQYVVTHRDTHEIAYRGPLDECMRERDTRNRVVAAALPRNSVFASGSEIRRVRAHLEKLRDAGVGCRWLGMELGMSPSRLREIMSGKAHKTGRPARVRRETCARILKAWPNPAPGALVDAGETWRILREMLEAGMTKTAVAGELGYVGPALQIRTDRVKMRTEDRVRACHDRLYRTNADLRAICSCPEWRVS